MQVAFDQSDWWLEEHGLIMEKPDFPLPAGKYVVTGDREITTVLTIAADGDAWTLDEALRDVTHLPCRSARYTPSVGILASERQAAGFPREAGLGNARRAGLQSPRLRCAIRCRCRSNSIRNFFRALAHF